MSGWDGVNLCHSSLHSALLSICGWISADKAPVSSWRWAAFVKHGGFLSPCQQRVGWGQGRGWEGTRQPWPKRYSTLQDLTFSNMSSKKGGRRKHVCDDGFCLLKQPLHMLRTRFPGKGWSHASQWEAQNECFVSRVRAAFLSLVKSPLPWSKSFFTFALMILSLILLWVSKRAAAWGSAAHQR